MAIQHGERRLERVDVSDRLAALEEPDAEVADAGPAHLARTDELVQRSPGLLDRHAGLVVGPVELEEVETLDPKPQQALLAGLADRLGSQVVADLGFRAL